MGSRLIFTGVWRPRVLKNRRNQGWREAEIWVAGGSPFLPHFRNYFPSVCYFMVLFVSLEAVQVRGSPGAVAAARCICFLLKSDSLCSRLRGVLWFTFFLNFFCVAVDGSWVSGV